MIKKHKLALLLIFNLLFLGTLTAAHFGAFVSADSMAHWHDEHGDASGGPAHSGGLDKNGCHNGSVPYHCHR